MATDVVIALVVSALVAGLCAFQAKKEYGEWSGMGVALWMALASLLILGTWVLFFAWRMIF